MQVSAASEMTQEDRLKAAYIYNFVKFVKWPTEAFRVVDDRLSLCVLEGAELNGALLELRGRRVKGRPIEVRRLDVKEPLPVGEICHVLYAADIKASMDWVIMPSFIQMPTLVVGDNKQLGAMKCMINFRVVDNKVHFDINLAETRLQGIEISSYLLDLAVEIVE
jgi:hypothetical protein